MGAPKKISSTVNLNVIAAIDQSSGEILSPEELESRARLFLSDMRTVQEELIKANISTLPSRENAKFGSKWARENVTSTTTADKILAPYIETYWTLNGCKSEATRIILAHQRRQDVVRFQDILDTTKSKLDMCLFDSRSNLNLFFIKKCVELLDDGGELIFIVPRDFLKATSAARLNHWLHQSGTFAYMHDLGEERVFSGFSPECVIFRFVKGDLSHMTEYVSADGVHSMRRQVETSGQFLFVENDYTVPFSSLFTVKVGAVSGANNIFISEHGNIEVVGSFTAKTGDLKRMYHGAAAKSALLPYKEELLSRKIRKFDEDNWWRYGREFYMSDEERIYVNVKTRNTRPFFYNSCKYFDGTVLALFPTPALGEMSPQEMQQLADELNDVDWHELGFVSGGRFLFGQHSLANILLPASFEKWIKS